MKRQEKIERAKKDPAARREQLRARWEKSKLEPLLQEATSPRTPPERLEALAHWNDTIAEAVAQNPNAQEELLAKLSKSKSPAVLFQVVQHPKTPLDILQKLSSHPKRCVVLAVARSKRTPPETLEELVLQSPNRDVRLVAAQNPRLPIRTLFSLWQKREQDLFSIARMRLQRSSALYDSLVAEIVRVLRALRDLRLGEPDYMVLRRMEDNDREESWKVLYKALNEKQRQRVASQICAPELLEVFAGSRDTVLRGSLSQNRSSTPSLLSALSEDRDKKVRTNAASNTNTPLISLERLAKDPEPVVRAGVARNLVAPPQLVAQLTKDPDESVRVAAAANSSCPQEVLLALASSSLASLASSDQSIRFCVSANPSCPKEALLLFARSRNYHLRRAILSRMSIDREVFEVLCSDQEWTLRRDVAQHRSCPLDLLERLSRDPVSEVRRAAFRMLGRPQES